MLKTLKIRNLTVFRKADLSFSRGLNVIVGENGSGKTHLLKIAYSIVAAISEQGRRGETQRSKGAFQSRMADKLFNVFRPEQLGRLARRKPGRERCEIDASFVAPNEAISFSFSTASQSEVVIETMPAAWSESSPAFLPTRELLTIFPNFVSLYEGHYLDYEETWRDTCLLLGAPLKKGPIEGRIRSLLEPIEKSMGGKIELDRNGRFYLRTGNATMEMPLVAEGIRKLGMLARLIATGVLLNKGYLFWDEPEANLNPKLVKEIARSILSLSSGGIQIFVATHSLFLLRELEILSSSKEFRSVETRFFGLHSGSDGVSVEQGNSISDIGDIASLDEELEQSGRFIEGAD